MPQSLVEKIKNAATFNQGYATTELVSAATLDMAWHSVTAENQFKPTLDFEKKFYRNTDLHFHKFHQDTIHLTLLTFGEEVILPVITLICGVMFLILLLGIGLKTTAE